MLPFAAILLAPLFADHAVLQQGKPVPVWGQADPGEKVTVTFGAQKVSALADPSGFWIAYLDALTANPVGTDLTVGPITIHDLVVGEVWLASGQSNMEFVVNSAIKSAYRVEHAAEEAAAANYPLIRQFKVAPQLEATPQLTAHGTWELCSPATVSEFSAVAYFYARDLCRRLQVPIGIVNATWGGSAVDAWMSPMALQRMPQRHPHPSGVGQSERQPDQRIPQLRGGKGIAAVHWNPALLYNNLVNPLVPYAIRGAIWYQGESDTDLAGDYQAQFETLITSWREHFGQGDFPFYWVQLANYNDPSDPTGRRYAELRAAQTAALELPVTGQAIAIDGSEPANPLPRNKQEIGHRLALIARHQVYGIPGDFCGPTFERAVRERDGLRVYFAYADNGLTAAAKPAQSFEVAGADGKFRPAAVTLIGATAFVRAAGVPHPVAVRYAWHNAPEANLYNGAGLPAAPFSAVLPN
jgi:sialate O-acetylesterase